MNKFNFYARAQALKEYVVVDERLTSAIFEALIEEMRKKLKEEIKSERTIDVNYVTEVLTDQESACDYIGDVLSDLFPWGDIYSPLDHVSDIVVSAEEKQAFWEAFIQAVDGDRSLRKAALTEIKRRLES